MGFRTDFPLRQTFASRPTFCEKDGFLLADKPIGRYATRISRTRTTIAAVEKPALAALFLFVILDRLRQRFFMHSTLVSKYVVVYTLRHHCKALLQLVALLSVNQFTLIT